MTGFLAIRSWCPSVLNRQGAVLWVLVALLAGCGRESGPPQDEQSATAEPPPVVAAEAAAADSAADNAAAELAPSPPDQLSIGDPHPGLRIAKWIKGESVQPPLTGKVHVVEFWATWCGPCRVGMPHLTELQTRYGDEVVFVGVTREDEPTVTEFLAAEASEEQTWDDVIGYRLALDEEGWTHAAYMQAANQRGIPCAFIVGREGIVEWIGHPGRIDQPLQAVVEGQWDRQLAIKEFKKSERMQELSRELAVLVRGQQWAAALNKIDEFTAEYGSSPQLMQARLQLLQSAGRDQEAWALGDQLIEQAWEEPRLLNAIAWSIATRGSDELIPLATKSAERAAELTAHQDPSILDTVARCYYRQGQLDEAVRWQQQAVEHGGDQPNLQATLRRYQAEQAAVADSEPEQESDAPKQESDAPKQESGEPEQEVGDDSAAATESDSQPPAAAIETTSPADQEKAAGADDSGT